MCNPCEKCAHAHVCKHIESFIAFVERLKVVERPMVPIDIRIDCQCFSPAYKPLVASGAGVRKDGAK